MLTPEQRSACASLLDLGPGDLDDLDAVQRAYRQRAREAHPDAGGDARAFQRVTLARETVVADLEGRVLDCERSWEQLAALLGVPAWTDDPAWSDGDAAARSDGDAAAWSDGVAPTLADDEERPQAGVGASPVVAIGAAAVVVLAVHLAQRYVPATHYPPLEVAIPAVSALGWVGLWRCWGPWARNSAWMAVPGRGWRLAAILVAVVALTTATGDPLADLAALVLLAGWIALRCSASLRRGAASWVAAAALWTAVVSPFLLGALVGVLLISGAPRPPLVRLAAGGLVAGGLAVQRAAPAMVLGWMTLAGGLYMLGYIPGLRALQRPLRALARLDHEGRV